MSTGRMTGAVRCERMVHGGLCIAHSPDGETLLVDGAIPGELVEAELRFRKKRTWFATVRTVIEPDPDRVDAPCPYVPECGGCQWQHIAYARQLTLKREIVVDALSRQHVPLPADIPLHGMREPWRYRRRGEFHVVPGGSDDGDARLGFNRARSWRPIAVDDCLIHDQLITDSLPLLRRLAGTATSRLDTLHVTAGEAGELLVRAKPRRAIETDAVDHIAAEAPPGARLSVEAVTLCWRGDTYRVAPEAFIQVNWEQMDVLYECVLRGLGDVTGLRLVDAYAGIGVLAVHLAHRASEVVCIESNRAAARLGVLNARLNEVSQRMRYAAEPVEHALPRLAADVDRVILDPPRAGCDTSVTGWLALAGPERVVYVSCDPATLARDLHVLAASGPYAIESLDVVDMFPQTHHVEVAVVLVRAA